MTDRNTDPDVYHEWSQEMDLRVRETVIGCIPEHYPVAKHKSYRKREDGTIYDVRIEYLDPATGKPLE